MTENERERILIRLQTLKYLAKGGTVTPVDHTANKSWGEPVKRTRKDQVDHMRKSQI